MQMRLMASLLLRVDTNHGNHCKEILVPVCEDCQAQAPETTLLASLFGQHHPKLLKLEIVHETQTLAETVGVFWRQQQAYYSFEAAFLGW